MLADTSITHWLQLFKAGHRDAVLPLWERYFRVLVVRARDKLRGLPRRAADEEDIALSAFASFCRGVEQGRFPRLDNRDDLWRLLFVITARKVSHQIESESTLRRGGGKVRTESDLCPIPSESGDALLDQVACLEPTPDLAAELAEEYRRLLDRLGDDELRQIAIWQMEGYTGEEIAEQIGRSVRTVTRKLQVIRDRWQREDPRP